MKIIITMAGEGRRFREIGIREPKFMVKARGKTLFEWSILSLKNFFDHPFIFVTRQEHRSVDFIREKCKDCGLSDLTTIELQKLTRGQADTALAAAPYIDDWDEEIMIYNIDTYVDPDELRPSDVAGNGWVPSFVAEGDRWSFVKVGESGEVLEIEEKVRISDLATIGLYYFKSFRLFREIHDNYQYRAGLEEYIAPLYQTLISESQRSVRTHVIDSSKVHVLGTPEDIAAFDPDFRSVYGS